VSKCRPAASDFKQELAQILCSQSLACLQTGHTCRCKFQARIYVGMLQARFDPVGSKLRVYLILEQQLVRSIG
jgi:hypothetical protein